MRALAAALRIWLGPQRSIVRWVADSPAKTLSSLAADIGGDVNSQWLTAHFTDASFKVLTKRAPKTRYALPIIGVVQASDTGTRVEMSIAVHSGVRAVLASSFLVSALLALAACVMAVASLIAKPVEIFSFFLSAGIVGLLAVPVLRVVAGAREARRVVRWLEVQIPGTGSLWPE